MFRSLVEDGSAMVALNLAIIHYSLPHSLYGEESVYCIDTINGISFRLFLPQFKCHSDKKKLPKKSDNGNYGKNYFQANEDNLD